jgi:hypothetical protein
VASLMRAVSGRPALKYLVPMARAKPKRNVSTTSLRRFDCWGKANESRLSGLIQPRNRQSGGWHETPGVAQPSPGLWLCAHARGWQPFYLEHSPNWPQRGGPPAQRHQKTPCPLHLPPPFRAHSSRGLVRADGTRKGHGDGRLYKAQSKMAEAVPSIVGSSEE